MSWKEKLKLSFEKNTAELFNSLKSNEQASLYLEGEESDFVRFNGSKVRQATSVEQAQVTLTLQIPGKLNKITFPMTGDITEDRRRFLLHTGRARTEMAHLPENPFPVTIVESGRSETINSAATPTSPFIIDKITQEAAADDFVGYMASGPMIRAIANSKGTFHWYSHDIYFIDYSLYDGQKAVTANVAGTDWNETSWSNSLNQSRSFLSQMKKPAKLISRGDYRVYLAPAAVSEILMTIGGWGGFSYGNHKQGQSGLRQLFDGEKNFSTQFTLLENYDLGLSPRFNPLGEISPAQISLIHEGRAKSLLTSSKSASEYQVPSNGADDSESPRSLELHPGSLQRKNILKELGTGLYLSNLHYVNWSDQASARMTGMTRFACFWVQDGEIISPIQDVRFDVSLYDIWGSQLLAQTDFQENMVNNLTYRSRNLGGQKIPGQLIEGFKFTL